MEKKKVYTVATAHLDTIWSWDLESTVSRYIYNTLVENIALLKKYPTYTFSFEGAYRYELMEEYYPELFKEMAGYIREGRWNVAGSAYENGDVNCPSPEALFRNILYGNSYFEEKFGKRSCDIYLPDCFGFGWALPSIARHANLKGFTTQKLAWGSAYGVPFDLGKWYGVDGNYVYASLNPHDYYFTLTKLRDWDFVLNKLKKNEKYGLNMTYIFHGIGDRGGAPQEKSVRFVEEEIKKNENSPIEVKAAAADEIFEDMEKLPPEVQNALPTWNTELVMRNHGVGGYTSRAVGKRWNDRCQTLAAMAEAAGAEAQYLGCAAYNKDTLDRAWKRFIAHQFHDDLPGTAVQRAYRRSWNDYALSMNQFTCEFGAYGAALTGLLKTDFVKGIPVAIYNSLEFERTSRVTFSLNGIVKGIRVFDDEGNRVKSQILHAANGVTEIMFTASVPPLGMRVYDLREDDGTLGEENPALSISEGGRVLQNQKYTVRLNENGDIASIIDKTLDNKELLAAPIVHAQFKYNGSKEWPAWEMNYKEANREPGRIPKLISIRPVAEGAVCVATEVVQKDQQSTFKTYICLFDEGEAVEVYTEIEWQSMRTLCKERMAFTAVNKKATFDLGLGVIERGNMNEKLFEVPAQNFADITNEGGEFGVSVISDCKHGWDKFNDNTLRLTVLHTPKRNYRIDSMQSMMDLGLNRFGYAIYSHPGKFGAKTQRATKEFLTPLAAFSAEKHKGQLGSSYSFGTFSSEKIVLRAMKVAQKGSEIVLRFNEGTGEEVRDFEFTLGEGIESAKELWASEELKAEAEVHEGKVRCSFKPFEVKTFAVKLKEPQVNALPQKSFPIVLNYNRNIDIIPENLRREEIETCGVKFKLGNGAVACKGQKIEVKEGRELKLLCASFNGEEAEFTVEGKKVIKRVNDAYRAFAHWDLYDFKETAYIKEGQLGYEFTHCLGQDGSVQYAKALRFWVVTLKGSAVLPKDEEIVILAASEYEPTNSHLLTRLYDKVENNRPFTFKKSLKMKLWYMQSKMVWNIHDKDDYFRHNNNGKNGKRVEQSKKRTKTRTIATVRH